METTARGDIPKTLHTIAYISIPESADLEFLLWDLQDAIAAYAQLSGTVLPRPVNLKANDAGAVDGIVLAIEDASDDETMIAIEQILDRFGSTERASMPSIRGRIKKRKQARRRPTACTRHASAMTIAGAAALSSVPAAVSRRFATPRVWASCADHFRKRWTSS